MIKSFYPLNTLITREFKMTSITSNQDHTAFALRLSLGLILLAHGALKLFIFTPSGTAAYFTSLGLPAFLAYVTILIEVVGGLAIVLGIYTRIAAIISTPILIGASWAHVGNGWVFSNQGGGWEFPVLLVVIAAIVSVQGAGSFAVKR